MALIPPSRRPGLNVHAPPRGKDTPCCAVVLWFSEFFLQRYPRECLGQGHRNLTICCCGFFAPDLGHEVVHVPSYYRSGTAPCATAVGFCPISLGGSPLHYSEGDTSG